MSLIDRAIARTRAVAAFTLIELLIVVAVIGILCAILIPVIAMVRDSAHTVQCMSSQRQLGLAAVAYSVDNRYYPPTQGSDGRHWHDYISSYVETEIVGADGLTYAQGITSGTQRRSLFRGCPLVGKFTQVTGFDESKAWGGYGMNYFYTSENFGLPGPQPWATSAYSIGTTSSLFFFKPPLPAAITFPSNRILTADSGSWSLEPGSTHLIRSVASIPLNSSDPIFAANGLTNIYDRHRGRRVVTSYFDGHVAVCSFRKAYCGLVAPDLANIISQ